MRKVLVVLLAVSLLGIAPASATAVKAGAKCSKHKTTTTVKGMKYTCIKSGNKLVWSKGVSVKKATLIKAGVCPPKSSADKDPGITQTRANALISMNEADAEMCATELDWQYRVGQRDEEMFALTRDFRIDRVTVTVLGGFVTQVSVG
jgi:hypothetical protein